MTPALKLVPQQLPLWEHYPVQPQIRARLDHADACAFCEKPTDRGEWFPAADGFAESILPTCLRCWLAEKDRQGIPVTVIDGTRPVRRPPDARRRHA